MAMNLYIHLGMSKSGSSTIQKMASSHIEGYMGKFSKGHTQMDAARKLRSIAPVYPRHEFKTSSVKAWLDDVLFVNKHCSNKAKRIFISDEDLSRRGGMGQRCPWPIGCSPTFHKNIFGKPDDLAVVRFLEVIRDLYAPIGKVKVVIVFRRQPEWLASRYVQQSCRNPFASQADFEKQIYSMIESNDRYIFWDRWLSELQGALGDKNVLPMFLEDMGKGFFWSRFMEFVESSDDEKESINNIHDVHENHLATDGDKWKVRPLGQLPDGSVSIPLANGFVAFERLVRLFPLEFSSRASKAFGALTKHANLKLASAEDLEAGRDPLIYIPASLKSEIIDYCYESNKRLELLAGARLEDKSYFAGFW